MDEAHAAGMQADTAVGIGAGKAILQVALDGAAHLGQLATDLMVAARLQVHLQQAVVVRTGDEPIVQDGLLAAGLLGLFCFSLRTR